MADEKTPEEIEAESAAAEATDAVTDEAAAAGADEPAAEAEKKPRRRTRRKPAEDAAEEPVAEAADQAAEAEAEDEAAGDEGDEDAEPQAEEKPRRRSRRRDAEPEKAAKPRPRVEYAPGEAPVVRAHAKYVRTSARKARLVCDHIRGKSVLEARAILAHTPRAVAADWEKLLTSAVANAEHNHELIGDELRILSITADEGPTLKRFRPRAKGRADRIRKRTSHLTITLTPKE